MNSVVWPGKLAGTILFEPIVERLGFKKTIMLTASIQLVALISECPPSRLLPRPVCSDLRGLECGLGMPISDFGAVEMTATTWQQFSVGRVIAYFGVGIVENVVPAYHSELAPAEIRGFFAGSVQVLVHIGAIWAAAVTRAYASDTTQKGWLVPTAQQLIPGILILIFVPFTIESPRWLLLHGKDEQALKNLDRIRRQRDVDNGLTVMEVQALDQANQEASAKSSRWIELTQGTYRRRCMVGRRRVELPRQRLM